MRLKGFLLSIFEFLINPFSVLLSQDVSNTKSKHQVLSIIIWVILSVAIAVLIVYLAHKYKEVV